MEKPAFLGKGHFPQFPVKMTLDLDKAFKFSINLAVKKKNSVLFSNESAIILQLPLPIAYRNEIQKFLELQKPWEFLQLLVEITYTILHALCVIQQTCFEYIIIMTHSMHVLKEPFQATQCLG